MPLQMKPSVTAESLCDDIEACRSDTRRFITPDLDKKLIDFMESRANTISSNTWTLIGKLEKINEEIGDITEKMPTPILKEEVKQLGENKNKLVSSCNEWSKSEDGERSLARVISLQVVAIRVILNYVDGTKKTLDSKANPIDDAISKTDSEIKKTADNKKREELRQKKQEQERKQCNLATLQQLVGGLIEECHLVMNQFEKIEQTFKKEIKQSPTIQPQALSPAAMFAPKFTPKSDTRRAQEWQEEKRKSEQTDLITPILNRLKKETLPHEEETFFFDGEKVDVHWDKPLGMGGFGSVFTATIDGETYAIKAYNNATLDENEIITLKKNLAAQKGNLDAVVVNVVGWAIIQRSPAGGHAAGAASVPQSIKIMEKVDDSLHDKLGREEEKNNTAGSSASPSASRFRAGTDASKAMSRVEVIKQLAKMLKKIHENSTSVLDLNESNVLIVGDQLKLAELRFSTDPDKPHDVTMVSKTILGTAPYTPAEQMSTVADLKIHGSGYSRWDVFAFGCILYRLITHEGCYKLLPPNFKPQKEETEDAILSAHIQMRGKLQQYQMHHEHNDPLYEFIPLCLRCLSEKPENRPKDGGVLLEWVELVLKGEKIPEKSGESKSKSKSKSVRSAQEFMERSKMSGPS